MGGVDDVKRDIDDALKKVEDRLGELEKRLEAQDPSLSARTAMRELRSLVWELRRAVGDIADRIREAREKDGGELEKALRDLEDYTVKRINIIRDRIITLSDRIKSRIGAGAEGIAGITVIPLRIAEDIGRVVTKALEESLEAIEQALGRVSTTVLSVRIRDDDLRIIDSLVEGGVFRSRSEAVAFFTHKGIECSRDWIERTKDKLEQIRRLQEEIRGEIEERR